MTTLKVIKNGTFENGDDVYQIGYEDKEGVIHIVDFSVMPKDEADSKLSELKDDEVKPVGPLDYEMERARNSTGHYVADDPSTPDVNEAFVPKKKPAAKKKAVAKKKKK